jgi:hypothetical protein
MVSKIIVLIITGALSISFSGIELGENINEKTVNPQWSSMVPTNRGIAVNKIPFVNITDISILPEEVQWKIEDLKETQGFYLFDNKEYGIGDEDGYHVLINLGQRNTGGYSIKVTEVEDNEGKTLIYVEEVSPAEGTMTTQAITYPFSLIKIKGVTPYVKIVSKDGKVYRDLSKI